MSLFYQIYHHTVLHNNRIVFEGRCVIKHDLGMVSIQCCLYHTLRSNPMHGKAHEYTQNGKASSRSAASDNNDMLQHGIDLSSNDTIAHQMFPFTDTPLEGA